MTISEIQSQISFLTNSTTSDFLAADRLTAINRFYHKCVLDILQSQDEWDYDDTSKTDFPILTTDLVANQQFYTLPSDALKIKRIEISLDGSNWYKARPMDLNERLEDNTQTSVNRDFASTDPAYDVQYGAVFLYPVPTTSRTACLKIWVERGITEFTSADVTTGTKTPSVDVMFHEYLAYGPAYEYCLAKNLPQADRIKRDLDIMSLKLKQYYGKKQIDGNIVFDSVYSLEDFT